MWQWQWILPSGNMCSVSRLSIFDFRWITKGAVNFSTNWILVVIIGICVTCVCICACCIAAWNQCFKWFCCRTIVQNNPPVTQNIQLPVSSANHHHLPGHSRPPPYDLHDYSYVPPKWVVECRQMTTFCMLKTLNEFRKFAKRVKRPNCEHVLIQ